MRLRLTATISDEANELACIESARRALLVNVVLELEMWMARAVAAYEDHRLSRKLAMWAPQCDGDRCLNDAELIDAARDGLVVTGALTRDQVAKAFLVIEPHE